MEALQLAGQLTRDAGDWIGMGHCMSKVAGDELDINQAWLEQMSSLLSFSSQLHAL